MRAVAVLGLTAAGCGSVASHHGATTAAAPSPSATPPADQFAWVRPAALPSGWRVARIRAGASIAYPPGWRPIHSDSGTVSEALLASGGRFAGYLNLTPQSGGERLAGWARFRVDHNGEEHDTHVQALAAGQGLHFVSATGSCVRDRYTTKTAAHYVEIACLVIGHHTGVVVVGAAPPEQWLRLVPQLERAVNSVRA